MSSSEVDWHCLRATDLGVIPDGPPAYSIFTCLVIVLICNFPAMTTAVYSSVSDVRRNLHCRHPFSATLVKFNQNAVARLVSRAQRHNHITPVLVNLHCYQFTRGWYSRPQYWCGSAYVVKPQATWWTSVPVALTEGRQRPGYQIVPQLGLLSVSVPLLCSGLGHGPAPLRSMNTT